MRFYNNVTNNLFIDFVLEFILADCKLEMYTIKLGKAFLLCDETREGYKHDVEIMKHLFQTYGFENPTMSKAENKEEVMTEIGRFRDQLQGDFGCLMVVIMCHGRLGHISLSNGEEIQLEDIYQMFSNRQCPALREKPKLFIVQACRGEKLNYVRQTDGNILYPSNSLKELLPTESDVMVVNAVCPDKLAIRHKDHGCPMFVKMSNVFKAEKTHLHMYELFTQVNLRLDEILPDFAECETDSMELPKQGKIGNSLHVVSSLTKKWYLK